MAADTISPLRSIRALVSVQCGSAEQIDNPIIVITIQNHAAGPANQHPGAVRAISANALPSILVQIYSA